MLLGPDPGTFSHFMLSFRVNLSSSQGPFLQTNTPLTSRAPASRAVLQQWLLHGLKARRKGRGRLEKQQRGALRRPGLLLVSLWPQPDPRGCGGGSASLAGAAEALDLPKPGSGHGKVALVPSTLSLLLP